MIKRLLCSALIAIIFLPVLELQARPKTYGESLCENADFRCIKVKNGDTWHSLFRNERERWMVMRLNRMNIKLRVGQVIAAPRNIHRTDYKDLSPFHHQINPTGNKVVIFDPKVLAFGAYNENGELVHWGPAVGGKNYCPDVGGGCRTTVGKYKIYRKQGPGCKSSAYPKPNGGAPMPYCMHFNGGYAMHASTDVPAYHASHGCIRLFLEDAQWLNKEFAERRNQWPGHPGTTVIVKPYAI